jgi:hypothetical protein
MKILLIIVLPILLTACVAKDQKMSELNAKSDVGGTEDTLLAGGVIVDDLCKVAERCRGVKFKTCTYQVSKLTGVPDAMGAPYGKYPTVHDLTNALEKRELAVNAPALNQCQVYLQRLLCTDDVVSNALGKTGGKDLSNIDNLLHANSICEKLIRVL